MTAFLTVDVLRAHAVPVHLREALRRADLSRPVLLARWLIAPDGRPICRWQTDDPAPEFPPD
jgi:hypothetical protein